MDIMLAQIGVVIIFTVIILITIGFAAALNKLLKIKLKKNTALNVTSLITILFLLKHFIFYGVLFALQGPWPTKHISEKIAFPISVFIKDDVLMRYDFKYTHSYMVKKYLDGFHLKTLAIEGNDNKIYVYHKDLMTTEWREVVKNVAVFESISDIPNIAYHVTVSELNSSNNFLRYHSDKTTIINIENHKEVAYSYRSWSYLSLLFRLCFELDDPFGVKKGIGPYTFIENVLFDYPAPSKLSYLDSAKNLNNVRFLTPDWYRSKTTKKRW